MDNGIDMKILIISVILVGLAVFLLCFNIIFRKDKPFPSGDIGANPELLKRGIRCATSEEMKLWGRKGSGHDHQCVGECGDVIRKIREEYNKENNNNK